MIYKKYEFSLSQNGDKIMHIARNAYGNVIFRGESMAEVKKMIDTSIEANQERIRLEENRKKELKNKKKKGLFQPEPKESEVEETTETVESESILTPPAQNVTRGPDGKFISKSKLQEQSEDENKSFWTKLTS
ncbi:MAG: hypothetical protein QY322_04335 [bacterium]|nr:MAG: hypothetical protein QY322_04335 [bacterium]